MTTRRDVVTCSVAAITVAGAMLAYQGADDSSQVLRSLNEVHARVNLMQEQIEELQSRVYLLESSVFVSMEGENPGERTQSDAEAAPSPGRVMRLEAIEQAPPDPDKLARAKELLEEAQEWESRAERLERQLAQRRSRGNAGTLTDDGRTRELGRLLGRYQAEARKTRGEAIRLQREATEARQIIKGWNGERLVVLRAVDDLSGMLRSIEAGDFLTWDGRRTYLSEAVVRYEVTRVGEASRPRNFSARDGEQMSEDDS